LTCVSRWIDIAVENDADAARCAADDLEDLRLAETVVLFGDKPRTTLSRGGHWVEFGYGLATGKRMILVGHRENIFAHLPAIEFFETWPQSSIRAHATTAFIGGISEPALLPGLGFGRAGPMVAQIDNLVPAPALS
jgi:hypothetical protein